MKLLGNNQDTQSPQQSLEATKIDIANYPTTSRPQLTRIWVEEFHEGKKILVAKWIAL